MINGLNIENMKRMMMKKPKFGVYNNKDRKLQEKIGYEHVGNSWRIAAIWKYLGPADSEDIEDVGNPVFWETPNRAYDPNPVFINIDFEQKEESIANLNQFNIINPFENQVTMRMHTKSRDDIGRYPVAGDVLQLFLHSSRLEEWMENMDENEKPQAFLRENDYDAWLEITNVDFSQEVENFYLVLTGQRAEESQQMNDIPNEESNQPILDNIQDKLEDEQEENVNEEGLDSGDAINVDNPFEDDGEREEYDTTPKPRTGFFDQGEQ